MPEFTVLTERQSITMLTKGSPTVINPTACQRLYENHFFKYIVSNLIIVFQKDGLIQFITFL